MTYRILMKAGPLRNGAERGHGSVWHAVEGEHDTGVAMCGSSPSIMWSTWTPKGRQVTCPRCLKKIAKMQAAVAA